MTDKKLTDEEIIKGLECCKDCSINLNFEIVQKIEDKNKETLELIDIINRQNAEIERLKKDVSVARDAYISIQDRYKHTKAESYKEFAERLKNKIKTECNPYGKPTYDYDTSISIMNYMDNLLKEMVGERRMTDLQNWLFADINEIIDCWSEKEGNDIE